MQTFIALTQSVVFEMESRSGHSPSGLLQASMEYVYGMKPAGLYLESLQMLFWMWNVLDRNHRKPLFFFFSYSRPNAELTWLPSLLRLSFSLN